MTFDKAKQLAEELCATHKLDTYVHTDPSCGFNIRFERPIEDVRPLLNDYRTVLILLAVR